MVWEVPLRPIAAGNQGKAWPWVLLWPTPASVDPEGSPGPRGVGVVALGWPKTPCLSPFRFNLGSPAFLS